MHIPDGFLSNEVALACAIPAVAAVGYGLRRAEVDLDDRRVPLLGVTAAFVFAAQMLNFPVAGGTSGHFLGAALAAVLLGPWLACAGAGRRARRPGVRVRRRRHHRARGERLQHGRDRRAGRRRADARRAPGAPEHARRAARRDGRRRLAGGHGRRRRLRGRARDLRHRAAGHRAAGDARRPRAHRRRRGGHHRRRRQRRARHPAGPDPRPGARARRPDPHGRATS